MLVPGAQAEWLRTGINHLKDNVAYHGEAAGRLAYFEHCGICVNAGVEVVAVSLMPYHVFLG